MNTKCLTCSNIGIDCLPHLIALHPEELLEWCVWRKKSLGLSNADIADKANVPKGTIDRLFAAKNTEFRYSTMQPVVLMLLGADPGSVTCDRHTPEENRETIEVLKAQVIRERSIAQSRAKLVYILGVALGVALLLIITALIVDMLNHDIGFFWLNR